MKIRLKDGLPYVTALLSSQGRQQAFENVLLDTGSAGTIFSADSVLAMGLTYEPQDAVHRIRGVGGTEFVFSKHVESLAVGLLEAKDYPIEIGAMDYGFEIDGIIGLDFLVQAGAVIDLARLTVYPARERC
jgi:hypothetical protein